MTVNRPPKEVIEELQNENDKLKAEATAIVNLAQEQNRELLPDELERFTAICGPPGEKGGLVEQNIKSMQRWRKIEEAKTQASRENGLRAAQAAAAGEGEPGVDYAMGATRPVIVPAAAKKHRPLAKSGFETVEEAYAAGMFFAAILGQGEGQERAHQWCVDHGLIKSQQVIGTPGKGGYLVPTPLERALIDIREQYGVMRQDARVWGMSANTLDIPKNASSLAAAPVAELGQMSVTDKDYEQVNLVARKWGVLCQMSSELAEDAIIDMAMDLARDMARAHAYAEDNSGFNGDGTGGFNNITGIKNALNAGAIYVATGKTTFAALEIADFEMLIGMLPNIAGMDPVWYMHKSAWAASMLNIQSTAGGNRNADLEASIMNRGNYDFVFLGYPGRFLNVGVPVSDEGASVAGAVYLGDLNLGVAFGDRRQTTIATSTDFYFDYDAIAVRSTERFDIQVHEQGDATDSGTIAMLTFGI